MVVCRFVGLFAEFCFGWLRFFARAVRKKRRNRRNDNRDRMSKFSWLHRSVVKAALKGGNASFFNFVHEDADERQFEVEFGCAVKCFLNLDGDRD